MSTPSVVVVVVAVVDLFVGVVVVVVAAEVNGIAKILSFSDFQPKSILQDILLHLVCASCT